VARRLLLLTAAIAAFSGSAPAVAVVSGKQRVLVVRATWGPEPFTTEQVERNLEEVDAFFQASSFGRVSFTGVVTPWLHAFSRPPACEPRSEIAAAGDIAARAAGYDLAAYTQIAYLYPATECFWTGARWGNRIFLNNTLTLVNTAHELGHTLGLGHAHAWSCDPRPCGMVNQGDPYDTMGFGTGDFNLYEKSMLGWITKVNYASRPGNFIVAPLEEPTRQPQGLIVTTARNRYWFEVRSKPAHDEAGAFLAPAGLLVHIGPNPKFDSTRSPYGLLTNALIMDPVGHGSPPLRAGDRFGEPHAFRLVALAGVGSSARVRFSWTDTTAPREPAIANPKPQGAGVRVNWRDSFERGSGIDHYAVSLDRRPAVSVEERDPESGGSNELRFAHVGRGTHSVMIVAVDRAGNRSAPAVRRFGIPVD
jgi:hypothetical protein